MSGITSKSIFTRHDREYDSYRKKLANYLNQPDILFYNNRFRFVRIVEIQELCLDNIGTGDFYHMVCIINRDGEEETKAYSVDVKIMNGFYRQEKLEKLIRGLKTKV